MSSAQLTQKRKPIFQRVPLTENVRLTPRDLEIFKLLLEYRFLNLSQIATLLNAGKKGMGNRLPSLFHTGYIDRIYSEKYKVVYALGNKGADQLSLNFGIPRGKRIDWTEKNNSLQSDFYLPHKLLIGEIRASFEQSCRNRPNVRLIPKKELLEAMPETTRRRNNPFSMEASIIYNGEFLTMGVNPDDVIGLEFLDQPEGRNKKYFLIEADRERMPVRRGSIKSKQSHFYKKLVVYYWAWKQGHHIDLFNFDNFRVLTVIEPRRNPDQGAQKRINTMIEENKNLNDGKGSGLFLFASKKNIKEQDILEMQWQTGQGELSRLLFKAN